MLLPTYFLFSNFPNGQFKLYNPRWLTPTHYLSIMKKIQGRKGSLLPYGTELALIKSFLYKIPTYLLFIIRFPKWEIQIIKSQIAHFFWDDKEDPSTWPYGTELALIKSCLYLLWFFSHVNTG